MGSWFSHGRDFPFRIGCVFDSRHLGGSSRLLAGSSSLRRVLEAWSKTAGAGIVARPHDVNTGAPVQVIAVFACKDV